MELDYKVKVALVLIEPTACRRAEQGEPLDAVLETETPQLVAPLLKLRDHLVSPR